MQNHSLELVDEFAPGYDLYIRKTGWYGPDMLFGMMYQYISKEELILDMGIGSGLNAILFHKAGLKVYGIDGSEKMLEVCKAKNITVDLKKVDLRDGQIPFSFQFNHVTSFAVFHFLDDLKQLFTAVSQHTKPGGSFGFSFDMYHPENDTDYTECFEKNIYKKTQADSGLVIYKHSMNYIEHVLNTSGFKLSKTTEVLAFHDPTSGRTVHFQLVVAVKL